MTLGDKQRMFATELLPLLLIRIGQLGYRVTLGEAWRKGDPLLHGSRLAIDLNLFVWNGKRWAYQRTTEAHRPLGEFWESLHPDNRWGGRFKDGNHYSYTHAGKA